MVAASRDIAHLIALMARLRDPENGCAWDVKQTFETIAPYTTEEAAEVVDAIARRDMGDLCEELGDLLLQVVFHAQIAQEAGHFGFADVVEAITGKLVRRHPHVFGDARGLPAEQVKALWDEIKAQEKADRAAHRALPGETTRPLLSDVPSALPVLSRAVALQAKAGKVGFDWQDPRLVLAKIREELDEVEAALDGSDHGAVLEEVGDVLFAVTNLARHLRVDPELALRRCNAKFESRFGHIERRLAGGGGDISRSSLDEMEALWSEAKQIERGGA